MNKWSLSEIREIIEEAASMKNAYFWDPPVTASGRSYEERHSHELVKWQEGGHTYTAEYIVECSCKNIYAYGNYTKDGNKTTLTAIKNSYNRLAKMA